MTKTEKWLEPSIQGTINAKELTIGKGAIVEAGVIISGKGGPAERVVIGDHCYIGQGTKIFAPEFIIGDYTKLNERSFGHGESPLRIGRNCWFGGNVVLDSMGGLDIDDNVGIGAGSQIWTHAQFGDVVEGCRFFSRNYMHIGKDAWFVGHCLVSPVRVEPRAMAMLGSVVTSDMKANHVYGGVPAKDLTEKLGGQFAETALDQKIEKLREFISAFEAEAPQFKDQLVIEEEAGGTQRDGRTYFNLTSRTYTRTDSEAEVRFLKKNVPLLKFSPLGEPPMYTVGV